MEQNPSQPNQAISYDSLYKQFNNNELNSRGAFELVYNRCMELEEIAKQLQAQNIQLISEKTLQKPQKNSKKGKK